MKNKSAAPYVFQRGNLYFSRWTFPHYLAVAIGKRELRRSLGTGYNAVARRRAMALAVRLQSLAAKFPTMRDITPQNLQALLDHYFREALNDREQWRCNATGL